MVIAEAVASVAVWMATIVTAPAAVAGTVDLAAAAAAAAAFAASTPSAAVVETSAAVIVGARP